jgi:hypothetical protein
LPADGKATVDDAAEIVDKVVVDVVVVAAN